MNWFLLENREKIPVHKKTTPKPQGSHLVKTKTEVLYKYYKCDYCGDEIVITENKAEMTGGILVLPHIMTRRGDMLLALCNKCLNPLLEELQRETKR